MNIQELYAFYKLHPVVTTDSRDCPEGSIFIALKGESFDGNKFAVQALEKGSALAVVDDEQVYNEFMAQPLEGKRMVLVPDSLQAFKDLAREHRRQFNIPIVGITGTNGKTTTKELVRTVLAQKFNVMATEGNFNNDVGVPKTLLRLSPEHEIAVVEMGASHPGDIKTLVETAEPTCGLITNVGKAHLQGFGSLEGVIKTKGELYDNLATRDGSVVFVNADNDHLMGILPRNVHALCYSSSPSKIEGVGGSMIKGDSCPNQFVLGEIVACDPFLRLRWRGGESDEWHEVATHLIGSYNLDNVLAAVTVGLHFGVDPSAISAAIAGYVPSNNRSQLTETGRNHLIVDAYNANPTSMAAAIDNFSLMQVSPKMAILGDMRELGESSHQEHVAVVEKLKQCSFDEVWLVGSVFEAVDCDYRKFADVEAVKAAITAQPVNGRYILIKGSNGIRLFQLPELL